MAWLARRTENLIRRRPNDLDEGLPQMTLHCGQFGWRHATPWKAADESLRGPSAAGDLDRACEECETHAQSLLPLSCVGSADRPRS